MTEHIYEWKEIEGDFADKLLLGNGASIAVWDKFRYASLYEEACKVGAISDSLQNLFKHFETTDFEYILRLLSQTFRVNELLGIQEKSPRNLYRAAKNALVQTISAIHPKYEDVRSSLLAMADFMKRFDTVLSLNYDLLVYWAMLRGNDEYGKWFKDGFVDNCRFRNDFDELYEPFEAEGATLVFYPHGNLILATETFGDEIKLSRLGDVYLLDKIVSTWEQGDHTPLFVSEGGTAEKLQAIRRSNYLDTVYDRAVDGSTKGSQDTSQTLVIYGWSFRDEDEHILKALINGDPQRIAISVYTPNKTKKDVELYCEGVRHRIRSMSLKLKKDAKCEIHFYDAQSKGCWNNPN